MNWEKLKRLNGKIALFTVRALYVIYPAVILLSVIIFLPRWASAGVIRKLALSPEKPAVVNLAFGNATAISFQTKPEKLVPGSPQKVQIDFLGKDITVSPILANPGNLLIYTSSGRYVILFKIVPESKHDDVVEVNQLSRAGSKVIRLDLDSYHIETVRLSYKGRTKKQKPGPDSVQAIAYPDRLSGEEVSLFLSGLKRLRCIKCVAKKDGAEWLLACGVPLPNRIECQSEEYKEILFRRGTP